MKEKVKNILKKIITSLKNKTLSLKSLSNKKTKKIEIYKKKLKEKKQKKEKIKKRVDKIQLKINFSKINYKKIFLNITIYSIVLILFILHSSFFKIKEIKVIALWPNSDPILIKKNLSNLKWKLIFKVDKNSLKNKILNIEQNLKEVKIYKNYPDKIKIEIISYNPIFKTKIKNNEFLITSNWVFIPKKNIKYTNIDNIELKNIKLPNFPLYKKILKYENLKKIYFIKEKLKENIVWLKIKDIIYYKTEKEIHFIINNNTRIIFDLVWDIKEKLKQLYVFNKETKNITKPWIIYIDNRILGKIYYCEKENEKVCNNNLIYIYWSL